MKRNHQEVMHNNYIGKDTRWLSADYDSTIAEDEAEMDAAMLQWEQMKQADPTLESKMDQESERNFANLMQRIKEEEQQADVLTPTIEPVMPSTAKLPRFRKYSKGLLLVAILAVLTIGMGMSAVGEKQLMVKKAEGIGEENALLWSDNVYRGNVGKMQDIYSEIEEKLGITPIQMGYLPFGMELDAVDFGGDYVNLIFKYGDQYIYFKQARKDTVKLSEGRASDRKESGVVQNLFLNQRIQIGENQLSNGKVEYEASWSTEYSYFYLDGIMEKGEFIKILEDLDYYIE